MSETALRISATLGGMVVGTIFLGLLMVSLPNLETGEVNARWVLLGSDSLPPIQTPMWLLFFAGLGDLLIRFLRGSRELRQMDLRLLPQEDEVMLRAQDLGKIYADVRPAPLTEPNLLQRLIGRIVLQFQGSGSINQANALLNSSLELFQHEIDLKYNMLRYLVWLIPTLGFIGTVIGIALGLMEAGKVPDLQEQEAVKDWMLNLTAELGLAFNTTLLALLLSAVLVFLTHIAQGREETALNRAGQYCLDNLINRLYEK